MCKLARMLETGKWMNMVSTAMKVEADFPRKTHGVSASGLDQARNECDLDSDVQDPLCYTVPLLELCVLFATGQSTSYCTCKHQFVVLDASPESLVGCCKQMSPSIASLCFENVSLIKSQAWKGGPSARSRATAYRAGAIEIMRRQDPKLFDSSSAGDAFA